MFYLHYAENGSILSVGNSVDNNLKHIVIDEKTFLDFNEGRKQTFEYKVIEDVKLNGKMHVVPTDIDFIDQLQHKKGKIKVSSNEDNCVKFIQHKDRWEIVNCLDNETSSVLSENDYFREYYITKKSNKFILFDKFTINLKDIVFNNIVIQGHSAEKEVNIMCYESYFKHIHTILK